MFEQFQQIISNLTALGTRRLAILAAVGVFVVVGVATAAFYLNRPAFEPIYIGLEPDDVTRMGMALADAGIEYDVNTDGTSILVPAGKTSRARMILAEKGLPNSSGTGYELFDNLGSLGLTAFMQEVTRVRALEGEIARSIQTIRGVKGARVHIVLADRGNFRFTEQTPTASVVVRYEGAHAEASALAIRHLVAAAVPGLQAENVTVLDASGRLLAAGDDPLNNTATSNLGIKATVENEVADSVYKALAPYLGNMNFRVSVQADINTDQKQIEETIFDPDSRVERSVQVVRSEDASAQQSGSTPATVEQNLPDQTTGDGSGPSSSERSERREETTNYELNTKRIATISNGYSVNRLSIAVVVNQDRIAEVLGGNADAAQVEAKLAEIRQLAIAAAGVSDERGDLVQVTAVEFMEGVDGVPLSEPGMLDLVREHLGTVINALSFVAATLLIVFLGLRPLVRALSGDGNTATEGAVGDGELGDLPALDDGTLGDSMAASDDGMNLPGLPELPSLPSIGVNASADPSELLAKMRPSPEERLTMIVDLDEERAAAILRRWVRQEAA
ncbi:flagellar basal-body MS-ring/collar protein FliF [Oricola thermophila]|uniref:Flagellar M-ring protein n=1 Tax=Oricola thermophila TaxID=2742145 RepID=A0A6N1VGJ6_9HYPH|nr:flagellar basal-body MS-ring/collar protein FliF [Oricola thermophila]QKV19633.1 flagellar M-ring protein FliF [Oricola thermophila]